MYVCMYVCMCVCMCVYVCMYVRTYVRTYVCMYVCMYSYELALYNVLVYKKKSFWPFCTMMKYIHMMK